MVATYNTIPDQIHAGENVRLAFQFRPLKNISGKNYKLFIKRADSDPDATAVKTVDADVVDDEIGELAFVFEVDFPSGVYEHQMKCTTIGSRAVHSTYPSGSIKLVPPNATKFRTNG